MSQKPVPQNVPIDSADREAVSKTAYEEARKVISTDRSRESGLKTFARFEHG